MKKLPLLLAIGALVAFPHSAFAQLNSGIEQYQENAPAAGGDRPTGGGQTGGGDGDGGGAAEGVGAKADGSGGSTGSGGSSGFGTGGAAARDASGSRHGDRPGDDTSAGFSPAAEQGSSRVNPVGTGADSPDEGGMGILLPIIVAASLVAALAFLVARRLRGRHAQAA